MVTVGEFCNRRVITRNRTDAVLEAAVRMRKHHVVSLVMSDELSELSALVSREQRREAQRRS